MKRPRYPFVALSAPLLLLLLFAFGPTIVLLTGGMVSDFLGCGMPIEGSVAKCPFMGVDFAPFFSVATAFGYVAFITIPAGTTLLGAWLVVAAIVTLIWTLRKRRID